MNANAGLNPVTRPLLVSKTRLTTTFETPGISIERRRLHRKHHGAGGLLVFANRPVADVAVLVCLCALAPHIGETGSHFPGQTVNPREPLLSEQTQLRQFQPRTPAECGLASILSGKDEDIDLALVNWLIAADVPQFADMTREDYFRELDAMIGQVRKNMVKMQELAVSRGKDPSEPNTRCGIFCNAIIKLRFAYAEQFRQENLTPSQMKALYADANNLFLTGLLRTKRGSCVSMPLVYLVIGQRLGMPVHLVTVGRHYFIRWEDPGYRMNIEPTIVEKVCVTPDDSVYLEAEGIRRDQVRGSDLRNLSNGEVVGNLFFTRSCYWATRGGKGENQRRRDLSRARCLAPDDPAIQAAYQLVFSAPEITRKHSSIDLRAQQQKGVVK
jgi:hypothetical protein